MPREMKDSGIEWIGEIPANWGTRKNKYLLNSMYSGGTPSAGNHDFYAADSGIPFVSISDMSLTDYVRTTKKTLTEAGRADKNLEILPIGTILYSIYATVGAVSELAIEATISQAMLALELKSTVDKQYYKYCLCSMKDYIFGTANGNTQFNLNAEKVWNFAFPFPSLDEQKKIADYLDKQCAEIDAVIAKTKATIEEYKKLKQSVITEAVTKGIRGDRPMKDSGIEWIGEIPAEWLISRVKNVSTLVTDGAHISPETEGGVYDFISTVNLQDGTIDFSNCLKTSPNSYEYLVHTGCKPQKNDVLISKDGTVGKTAYVDFDADFVVASSLVIIRPNLQIITPKYLNYNLQSKFVQDSLTMIM